MNYIELVNRFWELDERWQFSCCETRLYFYLLKTANRLGWEDSWTRSDMKVSSDVGVSLNSMKSARNRLVQTGLIAVKAGGNGFRCKTRYQILTPNAESNPHPNVEPNLIPNPAPINKQKQKYIPPYNPPKGEDGLEEEFERFRKVYPGTKRGLRTELENLKRKHKDWRAVVPLLMAAIEREMDWHRREESQRRFVPQYKNLQTWINNRCWEQELRKEVMNGERIEF